MRQGFRDNLQKARDELKDSQSELDELQKQIRVFEAQVDARLGDLLDLLIDLNAETAGLNERIREIREQRLFGGDLMSYTEGAPKPARPPNLKDLPPMGLDHRKAIYGMAERSSTSSELNIPDIKVLYRKLARRHHPDLARSDADRVQCNTQMAEINQAYNDGDLPTLMRLAGIVVPYGVEIPPAILPEVNRKNSQLSEAEQIERKLKAVRQQITRLGNLPIVKLSLEVKLARHQGRDLLHEMAGELRYKVARKTAERDYLKAQIMASEEHRGE
jgi:hypothetical protein